MKFSIVTPSYRHSEWLKLCIASVADQGVEHEHIIQDAGSDDGTLDWLRNDPRVQVFVEKDDGMYDAINRGFRRSSGEILAHLNCDEQYLPGALAAVAEFFAAHPTVEILFADAVVVDTEGEYLWHRKMICPRLWHTWTCHLTTLTGATFFRRSLLEARGLFFDPRWQYVGDGEWMNRVIRQRVRMGRLRRFTSVFTHTGENMSTRTEAIEETLRFHSSAPAAAQRLRLLTLAQHFMRRVLGGTYWQRRFEFELYTRSSPGRRVCRRVARPTSRWRW